MKAPAAASPRATWAPARKDMVGASLGSSRLWFTIAEGIVTEVYYPRIDIPQIKDLGFIIADDRGFWVELRRLGSYSRDARRARRAGGRDRPSSSPLHLHARGLPVAAPRRAAAAPSARRRRRAAALRAAGRAAGRRCRQRPGLGRQAQRPHRAVGRAGAVRHRALRGRRRRRRCLEPLFGRQSGGERRLAGLQPQRPHDLAIRQRRTGRGHHDGRASARGAARARPGHQQGGGGHARPVEPHGRFFEPNGIRSAAPGKRGSPRATARPSAPTSTPCWRCRRRC